MYYQGWPVKRPGARAIRLGSSRTLLGQLQLAVQAQSACLLGPLWTWDWRAERDFQASCLNGYNAVQQLEDIALRLLRKNTLEAVREFVMHRLSFSGVLRGHHVREADFADLHAVVLEDMGYSRCAALVLVLDHGKTN